MTDSDIRNAPHWYILQYPLNRGSIRTELQRAGLALEEEKKDGRLKEFESSLSEGLQFFAPHFFSAEDSRQRMSRKEASIFQNYVFVYGSQEFIYYLKQTQLPALFFFRSSDADSRRFPYVEQYVIDELKALEKRQKTIPYVPFVEEIAEGDKVKITDGLYKDFVATAIRDGQKHSRRIVLNVADWLVVPLCTLSRGSFEIVEYSKGSRKPYIPADISKHRDVIITGLTHHHRIEKCDSRDVFVAECKAKDILQAHRDSTFSSITMRCKHAAMMLYAATICSARKKLLHYKALCLELLDNVTSDYDKAVLYTALFGCYMDLDVFRKANDIVKSWDYGKCTKNKQLVLDDLQLYYEWHRKLSKKRTAARKSATAYGANERRWFMLNAWNVKTRLLSLLKANNIKTFCPSSQSAGFGEKELEVVKDKVFAYASCSELMNLQRENEEVRLIAGKRFSGSYVSFSRKNFESFMKICTIPAVAKEIIIKESIISTIRRTALQTVTEGPLKGVEGHITIQTESQQSKVFVVLDNILAVSATLAE